MNSDKRQNKQKLIKVHNKTKLLMDKGIKKIKEETGFNISYNEFILYLLKGGLKE